ncbi:ATP-binding protein [Thioalkalivibrio sp.]|uniref:PAS domain-containing sensor histidine kinase n=1 Tax=Thioalkalivibrio sp. TaxID=2093813 RepID=UPI0012D5400D|nr:ATP-binding protein [Thioalkalivibrio sp.]TVP78522.1 MAG: PAS domain S-box protein [Thioalkalivibrio sp.]
MAQNTTESVESQAAAGAGPEGGAYGQRGAESLENLFTQLCDWSPIGYAVFDIDGRFIEMNEAGARLLGERSRSEWMGESLGPLLEPTQSERVLRHLQEACDGSGESREQPCVVNVFLPGEQGGPRRLQFFSRPHPAGGGRLCLTAFQDISAEARRRESERQRQAVLDALSAHIAVLDATGRITAVNAAWRRFARGNGASRELETGIGLNYIDACCDVSAEDPDRLAQRSAEGIQAVINGDLAHFTLEYPCHSAQRQRWYLMSVTPLGLEFGGVVVVHMDISERVRNEQESRRRREEVAHASRLSSVTVLAASLVHELSQPLAAAQLYAEAAVVLGQQEPLNQMQLLSVVGDMRGQVDRATQIVDGLRRFMRRGESKKESSRLEERIHEAVTLVAPLARRKRVRLKLDLVSEPVIVRANALQIEQVLVNLLCNAIEAMDLADSPVRNIRVGLERLPEQAQVTVADTGPGLDPEWGPRIFEVLETRKESGMGMGLAISRTIVEAHGGRIWVESGSGGTVLCFTLPLHQESNPA